MKKSDTIFATAFLASAVVTFTLLTVIGNKVAEAVTKPPAVTSAPHPKYLIAISCESTIDPQQEEPVFFNKIVVDDSACYGKTYTCTKAAAGKVYKIVEEWCKQNAK